MDRNFFESRVSSGDDIADKDDASDIKEILDEDIANHKGLDPQVIRDIELYIEELRMLGDKLNVKLDEHPLKYRKNAGNCVTYSEPVFDGDDPLVKDLADKMRQNLNTIDRK